MLPGRPILAGTGVRRESFGAFVESARGGVCCQAVRPATEERSERGGESRRGGETEPPAASRSPASLWVSTTYFAEGFPYSVVNNLAEILVKELGASLQVVGLTALLHLPWNLKFLWAPLVDRFETKRGWLIAVEVALTIFLAVLAAVVGSAPLLPVIAALFAAIAVLSATHDIAIDGFYLEGLDDRGQSAFVGYRAMAYRIAAICVGGPLVIFIGARGWAAGLAVAAAGMGLLAVAHAAILPRVERRGEGAGGLARAALRSPWLLGAGVLLAAIVALSRSEAVAARFAAWSAALATVPVVGQISFAGWTAIVLLLSLLAILARLKHIRASLARRDSTYAAAFVDFLAQPKAGRMLAFVILFRAGESFFTKMRWPFLRDVVGLSLDQYGFANGTLGVAASFVATFVGGFLISRHGLRRWIWPFVLAQNLLILIFVWIALLPHPEGLGFGLTTVAIAVDQFGSGLGTAVFMVYLMRCCDPAHKAAHMAIVTALMSVSFTIAGVCSGFLAEAMGFANYFAFTVAVTFPMMILIPFVPHLDGREAAQQGRALPS
jgi:MFS transporter, PAT family, beta-lactamase induction signal transducer AmpG